MDRVRKEIDREICLDWTACESYSSEIECDKKKLLNEDETNDIHILKVWKECMGFHF